MNLFYPLCLSRRTLYPRRRICEHVLQHHLLEDAKAAVVVCDWIFAVGEKAEAPAMGWQRLLASARRRGENLFNMARNVAVKAGLEEQVRLGYWQEFPLGSKIICVPREFAPLAPPRFWRILCRPTSQR